jgi:AraC-like DNA-binding protein
MQPLIQKILIEEQHSFACRRYRTPTFETNWHRHDEYELILITEGNGTALIGDYVGEYTAGDIFFLTSNLPHWFRKSHHKMIGSAIVIHFLQAFWGEAFLFLPEMKKINLLLNSKNSGIQLHSSLKKELSALISQTETAMGIDRINCLLNCLQKMALSNKFNVLSYDFSAKVNLKENSAIEKIFDYSFKHYLDQITLKEVAAIAGMSIPTFCRFFKKNIKKSYFDFLQEIRISHACKLLQTNNEPILDICYNSGYNSWAHFSKQFKHVKEITPSQYRKQFKQE